MSNNNTNAEIFVLLTNADTFLVLFPMGSSFSESDSNPKNWKKRLYYLSIMFMFIYQCVGIPFGAIYSTIYSYDCYKIKLTGS